ncbi:MAG: hypothetical protein L7U72_12405 [Rubripirellula sp.]|nr:hypothetical protein [Rubripirellula sp.]
MSDDLEDFLARAAKRRAEKASQQREQELRGQTQRSRTAVQSQYSNRKTERLVRLDDDEDEILEAEIVAEADSEKMTQRLDHAKAVSPISPGQKTSGQKTHVLRSSRSPKSVESTGRALPAGESSTGINALELVQMLGRPGGVRQAFLLKEIIDRPVKRWE